jgi:hypothetical protein
LLQLQQSHTPDRTHGGRDRRRQLSLPGIRPRATPAAVAPPGGARPVVAGS